MTNMINGLSVAMICSLLFAVGCGSWTDGLKPGDIYSKDLDVVRNEGAADVRLLTVYGQLESAKGGADLSADDLVSIDQLRGMEEGQVLEGVFSPGGDVTLPYSFSISSKGNGSLAFGTYCIRIYDAHSDRLLFAPPGSLGTDYLLDQHQQDVNADGWLDLVFTGTAICTGEKESDPQTSRSVRSVFLYDPQTASFTNSVPDDAVYVYTVER